MPRRNFNEALSCHLTSSSACHRHHTRKQKLTTMFVHRQQHAFWHFSAPYRVRHVHQNAHHPHIHFNFEFRLTCSRRQPALRLTLPRHSVTTLKVTQNHVNALSMLVYTPFSRFFVNSALRWHFVKPDSMCASLKLAGLVYRLSYQFVLFSSDCRIKSEW